MEYFGLWVTRKGIISPNKKRGNKRYDTIDNSTNLTPSTIKVKWNEIKQKASKEINQIVVPRILSDCADLNKRI